MDTFEHLESEVRSYCRMWPTVFAEAQGHILIDEEALRVGLGLLEESVHEVVENVGSGV